MPSDQLAEGLTPDEVLSRASEFRGLSSLAAKLAPVGKVRDLYRKVRQSSEGFRLEALLSEMRITFRVDPADAARIPATGPVVVVANHPFGVLDGAILAVLLASVRPDVKVMTNFLLGDVPELQQHCIFVNPFPSARSVDANRWAVREALGWLQHGGMLAVFPAGQVSQWQLPQGDVVDPNWSDTAVRLIRRTGASAIPVYFCGRNSVGFHLMGMLHPGLRTAFLLQEFLRQEGNTIEVRVGSQIPNERVASIADVREATEYLRGRCYLLSQRGRKAPSWPGAIRSQLTQRAQELVAPALPQPVLIEEVSRLPEESRLAENAEFAVFQATAPQIPQLLQELGRLRELTFRATGEGTGNSRDLDRFDAYYEHLLLWHKGKQELVGAYRAGRTAEILTERGISGLYTSTLFRYHADIFRKLGPALELGRSFVRLEYQRQYAPLVLLWKGIARMVASRPETPVLFGAVSISSDYSQTSREMIYRFFEARKQGEQLAGLVEPRRPFRAGMLRHWDCRALCMALRDVDELSEPITDVEGDGKGVPILLRQYARVGGKMLAFNVDRKFSNVLDGLVLVDLRRTDAAVLDRYMGREAARAFRLHHGL